MTGYVVDASIAVKWLVHESDSEQAASLLRDEITLLAPELLFAEAAHALCVMCRRGDIDKAEYAEAVELLKGAPIDIPASMRQLIAPAACLAIDLDHPVYDCVYLALAVQAQYPVVTADRRFHEAVNKHPYLSDRIVHVGDVT